MGDTTKIEWADATWNPVRGCSRKSEGCRNCYAERIAARLSTPGQPYHGFAERMGKPWAPRWTGKVALVPGALGLPLRWRQPKRIFVNSTSDLFHEALPDADIDRVFGTMALAQRHTFMALTKRSDRMRDYLAAIGEDYGERALFRWADAAARLCEDADTAFAAIMNAGWPLANVWLGVSTEDQATADVRIPDLLTAPAAVRFISAEPLLGPIDLTRLCLVPKLPGSNRAGIHMNAVTGRYCESGLPYKGKWDITKPPPDLPPQRLDWVITGGESGPDARPPSPDWFRSLRDQCQAAGVHFFFKQWGAWAPGGFELASETREDLELRGRTHGEMVRVGKGAAGRLLDGREWSEQPREAAHA